MLPQASLTRALGVLASGVARDSIPDRVVSTVTDGFTDCVGVMLAGSGEPTVDCAKRLLLPDTVRRGGVSVLAGSERAAAPTAAFIGGVAAHVLDYDDVSLDGHPSAVLVPAILAVGEATGASGSDAVTAYVAGFEVWADLWSRERDHVHNKGWHPTCVYGAVAAAAACSRILRLDPDEAAHAIAIAASFAGGLVANFGSAAKSLQVGRASESGVVAAYLAASGATGSHDAIEHPQGFLWAISPGGDVDLATPVGDSGLWIGRYGLNLKAYPICYCVHRACDALFEILAVHPVQPREVVGIDVFLGATAQRILRHRSPATPLEAKFSAEFAMAAGIVAGKVDLAEFRTDFIARTDVQALMAKVARHELPDAGGSVPGAKSDRVEITLASGARLRSSHVEHASGSFERPMTSERLRSKFSACAAHGGIARPEALFHALQSLDSLASLETLRAA